MQTFLTLVTIILGAVIVALILMQGRGAGLGGAWGGGGELFQTRRGVEKITMRATMVCIVLFVVATIISFLR